MKAVLLFVILALAYCAIVIIPCFAVQDVANSDPSGANFISLGGGSSGIGGGGKGFSITVIAPPASGGGGTPPPTPFIWWKLENESLTNIYEDLSGNGFDAPLAYFGGSYPYIEVLYSKEVPNSGVPCSYILSPRNAETNKIVVPHDDLLNCTNTDFSIGCWLLVKEDIPNAQYPLVMMKNSTSVGSGYQGLMVYPDVTAWYYGRNAGTFIGCEINPNESIWEWHLMVATYDLAGQDMYGYLDGTLIASNMTFGVVPGNTAELFMGGSLSGLGYAFYANIAQPYITHSKLTQSQITNWFDTGTVPTNAPIYYANPTNDVNRYDDGGTNLLYCGMQNFWNTFPQFSPSWDSVRLAFDFDGVDDVMNALLNTNIISDAWTITSWLNTDTTNCTYKYPITFVYAGNFAAENTNQLSIGCIGGAAGALGTNAVFVYQGDAAKSTCTTPDSWKFNTNTWHHIAVSYFPTNIPKYKIYIDGSESSYSLTNCVTQIGTPQYIQLGRRDFTAAPTLDWNGCIDDVEIHDGCLTDSEILSDYNEGRE